MKRLLRHFVAGVATILLASTALANDELVKMQDNPNNWVMPTGDYANQRYSKLDQINNKNAGNLRVAWTFSTGVLRGHEGGPLVIGDTMYVHTPFPNIVYALDLSKDGLIKWKYEPRQDPDTIPVMCCDTVNRGPAYADDKIFLYQADTALVALNAKTGEEIWKVQNGDPKKGETGTSAPMVVKDKVIVGISGAEFGVHGHLTAYDMKTGKQVWRAYSTGPDAGMLVDPEKTTHLGKPIGKDSSLSTWQGDQWKIGGGTTWGWYAYDPRLNLITIRQLLNHSGGWNRDKSGDPINWSFQVSQRLGVPMPSTSAVYACVKFLGESRERLAAVPQEAVAR